MTRRQPEGRYTVGDKACPSLGCAIAYSTDLAFRTGQDQYVRVVAPGSGVTSAVIHPDGQTEKVGPYGK